MNQVFLSGYIAQDPQIKQTQNGTFAVLSLVTNEYGRKDPQSGQAKQYAQFHRVVVWDSRTAEAVGNFLKKGTWCEIAGASLEHRKYQDAKSGQDKFVTEVIVRHGRQIHFHEAVRRSNGADRAQGQDMGGYDQGDHAGMNGGMNGHAMNGHGNERQLDEDLDIPF